MADSRAVYVILSAEAQDQVHYAAPVKDGLWDFLNYAKQVTESRKSYKLTGKKKVNGERENSADIKVNSAEYLTGFHKDDHLMPVVTLMIYFGSDEWDGPMSILDMFEPEIREDKLLMGVVQNYKLNLLTPNDIPDEDFDKFDSELGATMFFLKKQNTGKMSDWIGDFNERFGIVERDTAELINELSRINLAIEEVEENGGIDMSKAFERSMEDAIETGRTEGQQETLVASIKNIMESFGVNIDRAMDSLKIPQDQRTMYAGLVQNS